GLQGNPLVDIGHPSMFSVRGRTYVREGEPAHTEVQSWTFESTDAEAAYLGSVLMGGTELPGVQLSANLLETNSKYEVQQCCPTSMLSMSGTPRCPACRETPWSTSDIRACSA
ncbi:hypothetical protein CTI14_48650, partial [Methylobacterium radiotolerans]